MMTDRNRWGKNAPALTLNTGFTILEILIALTLGMIFIAAICTLIIDQTQTHEDHQMKVMMQQNGRAALSVISNELMLAGYSPKPRADGGIGRLAGVEIGKIDEIKVTFDRNGNGKIKRLIYHNNGTTSTDYKEQPSFAFNETRKCVDRNDNNTNALLEDVEAFRVLYAYDEQDLGPDIVEGGVKKKYGVLEEVSVGGSMRTAWAFDKDGNGELDRYYTLNDNGTIRSGPTGLTPEVSIDRVRAVKIWLLMRSQNRKNKDIAEAGLPSSIPGKDGIQNLDELDSDYAYRLYTTTVKFRNMYY